MAQAAPTITWHLSGTFDDRGSFSGSVTVDFNACLAVTGVIATTAGTTLPGAIYNQLDGVGGTCFPQSTSEQMISAINLEGPGRTFINLTFFPFLTKEGAPASFSGFSQEYINIVGQSLVLRNVVGGSVSTDQPHMSPIGVPTLSTPALALMLLVVLGFAIAALARRDSNG